jgi:hypothetical protein
VGAAAAGGGGGGPLAAGIVSCLTCGSSSPLAAAAGLGLGGQLAGTPGHGSSSSPVKIGAVLQPVGLSPPASWDASGAVGDPVHQRGGPPGPPEADSRAGHSSASLSAASPPVLQCRTHHRAVSAVDVRGPTAWSASPPTAGEPGKGALTGLRGCKSCGDVHYNLSLTCSG